MSNIARALTTVVIALGIAGAASLRAQNPVPPVKVGLWETRMSVLDASGKEVPAPELAAFARMSPQQRAQMAEMMKARGVIMPDESGAMKSCLTKELLDAGAWQSLSAETGCTTTYSTRTNSLWKWHTSCASIKTESDGEMVFTGSESYRTKMISTTAITGTPTTSTRIIQGKWLGAACGDVKPIAPPATGRGR